MNDRECQVTMKTIAERAGVSLMSVSRALRNERGISPATRKRILKVADRLGYRPNPLVGALMANLRRVRPQESVQTIAFITSHATPDEWRDYVTPRLYYDGARARAARLGFRLEAFWLNDEQMPGPRLSSILRARGVRGAIICPSPFPGGSLGLNWGDLAAVALGYSVPQPQLHRATNHQAHTIRLALTELVKHGYRRIGLAVPTHYNARVDHNWSSGFFGYQDQVPVANRVPMLLRPELDARTVQAWVKRYRPDAVVGGMPLEWLGETGIAIPEEMGYAELHYHPSMGDIAGVDQNIPAVGAAAVDLVVEQLYHNQSGIPEIPKVVMIEGKWHAGGTVRPVG